MPRNGETEFNRSLGEKIIPAYQRLTGVELTLVAWGREFPDIICRRADGAEFGIELVGVVLSFINEETEGLRNLEAVFGEAIQCLRPLLRHKRIGLQISHSLRDRPHHFPHRRSEEAKVMAREFVGLFQALPTHIAANGALLSDSALPHCPTLMRHFDAFLINDLSDIEIGVYGDDPRIDMTSGTIYNLSVVEQAVSNAVRSKVEKGSAYSTDMLLLHTAVANHRPSHHHAAFHSEQIVIAGRELAPALQFQFKEVWYYNEFSSGERLHRLF